MSRQQWATYSGGWAKREHHVMKMRSRPGWKCHNSHFFFFLFCFSCCWDVWSATGHLPRSRPVHYGPGSASPYPRQPEHSCTVAQKFSSSQQISWANRWELKWSATVTVCSVKIWHQLGLNSFSRENWIEEKNYKSYPDFFIFQKKSVHLLAELNRLS